VEIGPKGQSRDVDLLLRLGSTVFIGELKCKVFPATPKDLRWHFEAIEQAAAQARLRAELARAALGEVGGHAGISRPCRRAAGGTVCAYQ
jgi:hypothetical protein